MSQQINLYNPIFLAQRKHFSVRAMGVALAVIAAALTVVALAEAARLAGLREYRAELAAQRSSAEVQLAQLAAQKSARAPSPLLKDELNRLQAELKTQGELVTLLQGAQLGSTSGYSRYLRALAHQTFDGVWLTRVTLAAPGDRLSIEGRVARESLLPEFLRRLGRDEVLRGRSFGALEMSAAEPQQRGAAPGAQGADRSVAFRLAADAAAAR